MRSSRLAEIALLMLCSCAVHCSGSEDEGGGSALPARPVPADAFCEEYVDVSCSAAQRCGCLEQYSFELCSSVQRSECADEYEQPIESGRFHYDPTLAGQCLRALQAIIADCTLEGDDYPASCDAMLTGAVPQGGACDDSDECAGVLECIDAVCARLPGDGEACDDGRCADDLFCGDDEVCRHYRGVGGGCAEGSYACADDLYCDPRTETCQPYLQSGASCDHAEWACDDDLECVSDACQPYPGPGTPCVDETCADDAYCEAGTCRASKPDGAACARDDECLSQGCEGGVCAKTKSDICSF